VEYDEAVEEALCFGWIDSKPNKLDEERSMLWFAPRKPGSTSIHFPARSSEQSWSGSATPNGPKREWAALRRRSGWRLKTSVPISGG